jgi:uncharacterized membrane protein YhaH (DUF805 family)
VNNPYTATASDLSTPQQTDDTYEPSLFALNGRIGRVRYLAYHNALMYAFFAGFLVIGLSALASPALAIGLAGVAYVALLVGSVIICRRRFHDLNKSGWLWLLMLVPLVNVGVALWLVFGRGDEGSNDYGQAPAPNTSGVVALAWSALVFPVLIGILAAVSIPAYQAYQLKARAAQVQQERGQQAQAADAAPAEEQPAAQPQADQPADQPAADQAQPQQQGTAPQGEAQQ